MSICLACQEKISGRQPVDETHSMGMIVGFFIICQKCSETLSKDNINKLRSTWLQDLRNEVQT